MKLSVFSAKAYDKHYLTTTATNTQSPTTLTFHPVALTPSTASLATGSDAICAFVNDTLSAPVLETLHALDIHCILLRCAGYNNIDVGRAQELGFFVANVPAYSPEAVAEFAVSLVQTLNRKTHRAYNRVREGNFNIEGLLGRTLHGKTVGVVGTGRIGVCFARIMRGFGCRVLAFDVVESEVLKTEVGGSYVGLEELLAQSDVVSLHCPLLESTRHLMDDERFGLMKRDAVLVNTSRGGLVDTAAAIRALKGKKLGGLALDVYEGEGSLFFNDHSGEIVDDDELMRLMTFHNVLVCGHQAFFTEEALTEIAEVTLANLDDFAAGRQCKNSLVKAGRTLVKSDNGTVRV
ncbi:hypothetical protein MBLNU230_g5052t1 [Neophaeotheca triangularis]